MTKPPPARAFFQVILEKGLRLHSPDVSLKLSRMRRTIDNWSDGRHAPTRYAFREFIRNAAEAIVDGGYTAFRPIFIKRPARSYYRHYLLVWLRRIQRVLRLKSDSSTLDILYELLPQFALN